MQSPPLSATPLPIPEQNNKPSPFTALRHPKFRLFWIGLVISAVGTWMQIIAQSLLVLHLTHGSAIALGIVSLAQALSFFAFAFIGGFIADRFDKRRLLLVTQSLSMSLAFLLGILTAVGVIQVWMIVILAFCSGSVLSFDQPTRSALVPLLVPKEELMNAISLQAVVFNGASVLGPALAGASIYFIGYAGNFFLNGFSFLGVLLALFILRITPGEMERSRERRGTLFQSVGEALRIVRQDQVLPWVLSGYAVLLFLGPSPALILPIFGMKILHLNTLQITLLFSASGLGTIIGGLLVAALGNVERKGELLLGSLCVWAIMLFLFALSHVFWLSLIFLFVFGMAQNGVGATTITLMQTRVPPQMRGRIMSLNTLCIMGVRPLGDFPAGALISGFGAPVTVFLAASMVGSYAVFLLTTQRQVRAV